MNSRSEESSEELIIVARTVKTRGLKGELVADLLTDFPERFERISVLWGVGAYGSTVIQAFKTPACRTKRLNIRPLSGWTRIQPCEARVPKFFQLDLGVP